MCFYFGDIKQALPGVSLVSLSNLLHLFKRLQGRRQGHHPGYVTLYTVLLCEELTTEQQTAACYTFY